MFRTGFVFFILFNTVLAFGQHTITLEDIWKNGVYRAEDVRGISSLNDGTHYTTLKANHIIRYSYETGDSVEVVLSPKELMFNGVQLEMEEYQFNATETQIVIATEEQQLYRHSSSYRYFIFNRTDRKLRELADGKSVFHATLSPTSNQVAYVLNNDIYVEDLDSKKTTRMTTNGQKNQIINGMSDWVYEEEFAFTKAFDWSPDGRFIAYYEFDESRVKEFSMPMYEGSLYPTEYKFKYPKAGEANSKVSIFVYDVTQEKRAKVEIGERDDVYIPRIKWTHDPATLSVQRMNRLQNRLELLFAHAITGKTRVVLSESSDTYIDITDDLTFLDNGQEFIWSSEKDGFNHLYLYDVAGTEKVQLTSGEWEVTTFYGVDAAGKNFYFQSTEEGPTQQHVYAASLNGNFKRKLTPNKGFNEAEFSSTMEYFINKHSDLNSPPFYSLFNSKGKQIWVLNDNGRLKDMIQNPKIPKKEMFTFTPSHGIALNGWMVKPADFDPSKKYPVMVVIYGGPGKNTATDSWDASWSGGDNMWHRMLAQKGFIVVSVDNRGTMYRGRDFKHSTYRQLGKLEVEDYIETAMYLSGLPYVNGQRIGIYGWSYGGYMSSLAITKGADHFTTAVAVAPVTNWRFYDSIYTERFMRTPQENAKGYDDNSPINHVEKLNGAYLLVHGTGDDNVHFQNTVEMTEALIEANKQFDLYIYPDRNHGIYGKNARLHLFTKITDFIQKNL